jgi:hypothetical protein
MQRMLRRHTFDTLSSVPLGPLAALVESNFVASSPFLDKIKASEASNGPEGQSGPKAPFSVDVGGTVKDLPYEEERDCPVCAATDVTED